MSENVHPISDTELSFLQDIVKEIRDHPNIARGMISDAMKLLPNLLVRLENAENRVEPIKLNLARVVLEIGKNGAVSLVDSCFPIGVCPFCNQPDCNFSCDYSQAEFSDSDSIQRSESEDEVRDRLITNACIDTIESYTMALVGELYKAFPQEIEKGMFNTLLNDVVETVYDGIDNNAKTYMD